ncbi:unnamed protein product [Gongylonema pulchrum]|uniref:FtsX-like permease family protein n=1 Tax=Gongylonema pulchrum TaxID=637853 RepID=A0A183DD40_9BILA|nr:unnamed protein product [Gongylonema pulchrum]
MRKDENARKMCLHISSSYASVVGNDVTGTARRWAQSIADTVGISQYRIKNPVIAPGTVFNFTVTVPFEEEEWPISAEEISLIIKEDIEYGELNLQNQHGVLLPVQPLQWDDIIELIALPDSNTLMIVTAVIVITVFISSSIAVAFLVVLKIRNDRVLNSRERTAFIDHTRYLLGLMLCALRVAFLLATGIALSVSVLLPASA